VSNGKYDVSRMIGETVAVELGESAREKTGVKQLAA
jgi:hypothetical protein